MIHGYHLRAHNLHKAYAVGVVAYGYRDLVCRAMFIPAACADSSVRRQTVVLLSRLAKAKNWTTPMYEQLYKLHPKLRRVIEVHWRVMKGHSY